MSDPEPMSYSSPEVYDVAFKARIELTPKLLAAAEYWDNVVKSPIATNETVAIATKNLIDIYRAL